MTEEKKTIVTDGQNLANEAADLKKKGVELVIIEVDTFNHTKYKKATGNDLKNVIDGINKCTDNGIHVRLNVGLIDGETDDEIVEFLQLTIMHNVDVVFLPTMDYGKIRKKLPGLVPVNEDFGEVEMFKYSVARGMIGFLKN